MLELNNKNLFKCKSYINGEWLNSVSGQQISVLNPYTNEVLGSVPDMSITECKAAIECANIAYKSWHKISSIKRAGILKKWFQLIEANAEDLAKILTLEQGKPLSESIGEIRYGASFVEWFAEEAKRVYGDVIPAHTHDKRITVLKQAIGVVAAITPWNFPNAMITRKVAPALAAGCTVVIKPSELTPFSALALAELACQAGFPKGVFNIITTSDAHSVGQELCTNPLVKKLSFTGSTKVGKQLMKQSADTVKKLSLELGGNAPFIVFEDADIDAAVEGAIASKFRNTGQTCVSSNRLFIHESIFDEFLMKFSKNIGDLKLGYGLEDKVHIGPMINKRAIDSLKTIIQDAKNKGASVDKGGHVSPIHPLIFEPTIITDVNTEMLLFHKEIFGPIAPILKFKSEQEVIDLANDTNYGLASYFYGKDYARIWRVAEALDFGMVGINTGMISTTLAPFGGIKESGFGREGSKYGIEDFVNIKYMCWGGVE